MGGVEPGRGRVGLWVVAACLYVAAIAVVYFDGYDVERTAYESGELSGVAFRWVAIGMVIGLLANIVLTRRRGLQPSWSAVTSPEAFACGAVLSVVLAFASGAPATELQEFERETSGCARSQANPIDALPAQSVRELSDREVASISGDESPSASGEERFFIVRASGGTVVGTLPTGNDEEDQEQTRAGFVDGGSDPSDTVDETEIAGLRASVVAKADGRLLIYVQVGCYGVITAGPESSARRLAETIVEGGP
jgi:hypothetical protein